MNYKAHEFATPYLDVLDVLSDGKKEAFLNDLARILSRSTASVCGLGRHAQLVIDISNDFKIYASHTEGSSGESRIVISTGLIQHVYTWSVLTLSLQRDQPPFGMVNRYATWLLDFFSAKSYGQYETVVPGVSFGTDCWIDVCGELAFSTPRWIKNLSLRCAFSAIAFLVAHELAHATPRVFAQLSPESIHDVVAPSVAEIGYPENHFDDRWVIAWCKELVCDFCAGKCMEEAKSELENMDAEYSLVYDDNSVVELGAPLFVSALQAIELYGWMKYDTKYPNETHPPAEVRFQTVAFKGRSPQFSLVFQSSWWAKTHAILALCFSMLYEREQFEASVADDCVRAVLNADSQNGLQMNSGVAHLDESARRFLKRRLADMWEQDFGAEFPLLA